MCITIDLKEWESTTFITHPQLAGKALSEDDATQALVETLSRSEKLIISQMRKGLEIEASSFVGRIAVGDLQITIRPKIEMLPLLNLLQYAYRLRHLDLFSAAGFNSESLSFKEVLVYQLAAETSELLSRGLRRKYVRREESLSHEIRNEVV
jgi:5-methylcytosine-specific restriction enzyme subunit McrC